MSPIRFALLMTAATLAYVGAFYIPITHFPGHDIWGWATWCLGWTAGICLKPMQDWLERKLRRIDRTTKT